MWFLYSWAYGERKRKQFKLKNHGKFSGATEWGAETEKIRSSGDEGPVLLGSLIAVQYIHLYHLANIQ